MNLPTFRNLLFLVLRKESFENYVVVHLLYRILKIVVLIQKVEELFTWSIDGQIMRFHIFFLEFQKIKIFHIPIGYFPFYGIFINSLLLPDNSLTVSARSQQIQYCILFNIFVRFEIFSSIDILLTSSIYSKSFFPRPLLCLFSCT